MESDPRQLLLAACRALLRPIALMLLKGGVTWREFAALSKAVFVSVASDEFGKRNRPTNVSRVSILTGISRKEVKRQRELLAESPQPVAPSKSSDATRLLSGWHQDGRFLDADGAPLPLPSEGDGASFARLFADYGGDTPIQTLLRELKSAGSVEENSAGEIVALRRFHMPTALDDGAIRFFGTNLYDHANTLVNNIAQPDTPQRLEGFAVDTAVDERHIDEFRAFLDERGQHFLEEIDDWLRDHRIEEKNNSAKPCRLGIGVYGIEGPLPEGTPS